MKDDSMLSSLSSMSNHANNLHYDMFNDSSIISRHSELREKNHKEQEEVDLNELSAFQNAEPLSPKQHGLLMAAYWTMEQGLESKNSNFGSEEASQEEQHDPLSTANRTNRLNNEEGREESEENSFLNEEEPIGIVIKNETKNIPKNYGKAIISYIEKERENFEEVLKKAGIDYSELLAELSKKKKHINTIANLRELWVDFKYAHCMRILSNQFLRKHALQYIFNSRICNFTSHIKYRKRLQEAIETPYCFRHIKEY